MDKPIRYMPTEKPAFFDGDGLALFRQIISGGVTHPALHNYRNGGTRVYENGHLESAEPQPSRRPQSSKPAGRKHATRVRHQFADKNDRIKCYYDKAFTTKRPRPLSPEILAFYADEDATAEARASDLLAGRYRLSR